MFPCRVFKLCRGSAVYGFILLTYNNGISGYPLTNFENDIPMQRGAGREFDVLLVFMFDRIGNIMKIHFVQLTSELMSKEL